MDNKDDKISKAEAQQAQPKPEAGLKEILGKAYTPELEKALNAHWGKTTVPKAVLSKTKEDFRTKLAAVQEKRKGNVDWDKKVKELEIKAAEESKAATDKFNAYRLNAELEKAKAKNSKAVMALLDQSKITFTDEGITGLTEQLDAMKGGKDSYLFDIPTPPSGTDFKSNPQQHIDTTKSVKQVY